MKRFRIVSILVFSLFLLGITFPRQRCQFTEALCPISKPYVNPKYEPYFQSWMRAYTVHYIPSRGTYQVWLFADWAGYQSQAWFGRSEFINSVDAENKRERLALNMAKFEYDRDHPKFKPIQGYETNL